MTGTDDRPSAAAAGGAPLLRVRGLRKSFGADVILQDVTLEVFRGTVTCIIGPSGSGKSTLLRCINFLERPDEGTVVVDGEHMGLRVTGQEGVALPDRGLSRQRAKIGMVFQRFNLFEHMTVLENIIFGPTKVLGVARAEAVGDAEQLLERVGLAGRASSYPRQLSGGQQQRVSIARALAMKPKLLLCDEPTSALDPELVGEVLRTLRDLAASGTTMVVVTHEIAFAREVADRVVFMDDGRIVASGSASEILESSRHARVQAFLGQMRGEVSVQAPAAHGS